MVIPDQGCCEFVNAVQTELNWHKALSYISLSSKVMSLQKGINQILQTALLKVVNNAQNDHLSAIVFAY